MPVEFLTDEQAVSYGKCNEEPTRPEQGRIDRTDLAERIGPAGSPLIIAGFMTHMCVSSTARAALDLGYPVIIPGDACATRSLPTPDGEIAAADVHRAELAALADRFAWVVSTADVLATVDQLGLVNFWRKNSSSQK